jgi:hypothetical protein
LELNGKEAETIRRAVHLFVHERKGSTEIFRMLNAEGRPSRGGPGRTQRTTWSTSKVKQLLARSDHLAGTWTYRSRGVGHPKDVNGPPIQMQIPPLLSEGELAALHVRLAETSRPIVGPGSRPPYLLARRITTPHGTPMHGNWRKYRATAHYMCGHTQRANGWPRCGCHSIEVTALDDVVWRSITERLLDIVCGGDYPGDLPHLGRSPASAATATGDSIDRVEWVWRIATGARDAVASGEAALRHRIVELLDVHVHVTGWHVCPTCAGKGWLPDRRALPKVRVRPPDERMQPLKCPICHAYNHLPDVEVSGMLPALAAQAPPGRHGTPFRVVSSVGEAVSRLAR